MLSHNTNTPKSHRQTSETCPLTHKQLPPMGAKCARDLSRRYHLALATLRTDHANLEALARLFTALGTAWGIHEAQHGRDSAERQDFEVGWKAMLTYLEQLCINEPVRMSVSEAEVLEQLLTLHDTQLAIMPVQELRTVNQQFARLLNLLWPSDTSTP
ncbi:hypothetical protein LFL97_13370 [Burkholderia sp. JSH-S8]|nr:hypothetical protein LFL97_13370 [Burkholderia sp. JSH-S8]